MSTRRVPLVVVTLAAALSFVGLAALPSAATAAVEPITATISASATETVWSEPVIITATMAGPAGSPRPTGTVTYPDLEDPDGDQTVGTAPLYGGVARLRTKALPAGSHTFTATHQGDGTYPAGTTTGHVTVVVAPATTTTTLVSRKTEVLSGTAWFQATVAAVAPASGAPTGTVDFTVDGTPTATVPLSGGMATWRPRLADGPHTITAAYTGSENQQASTSAAVQQHIGPPTTPGTPDQISSGNDLSVVDDRIAQSFTVGATGLLDRVSVPTSSDSMMTIAIHAVDESGTPTGPPLASGGPDAVSLPAADVPLSTPLLVRAGERYALVVSTDRGVSMEGSGSNGYAGGGMMLDFGGFWIPFDQYDLAFTTYVRTAIPSLSVSTPEAVWSQYVDLTVGWTVPSFLPQPTGTVRFLSDGVEIGTATVSNAGTARLRTKALTVGPHAITAIYDGDDTFPARPVTGTTVTVARAETTTTLVSRKTEVLSGSAWFQATVAPVAPATSVPISAVTFSVDGTPTATVPLVGGVATWRPRLADGPHTITVDFPGNFTHQSSSGLPVEQQIGS
ncbi:MAG TPA: Ig-like domain-containing protein [Iamia sp.]|nr:Ig-like domain-containing protein [Iamia sp.]